MNELDINEDDLLPCPFCGGKAYFTDSSHTIAGTNMIICSRCGCRMYGGKIEMWNQRIKNV
jgi:C4-type Zn-finger protein